MRDSMASMQERAYALWEARGRPLGDDWADWFTTQGYVGDGVSRDGVRVWKTPLTIAVTLNNPLSGSLWRAREQASRYRFSAVASLPPTMEHSSTPISTACSLAPSGQL